MKAHFLCSVHSLYTNHSHSHILLPAINWATTLIVNSAGFKVAVWTVSLGILQAECSSHLTEKRTQKFHRLHRMLTFFTVLLFHS